ncbi:hypothetical protein ACM1ZW_03985 [Pseudomonas sp. NFX71]|uniref:hypothetical protein n=1 Tax=Pseudomonas sp. NFX71 TaxID=3399121 RepID=UPI003A84C5E5
MVFVVVVAALIIAGVYSAFAIRQRADIAWGWAHALCSTLVSVTLALAIGIGIFHIQTSEQDKEERARWKMLVATEYTEIQAGTSGTSMNVIFSEGQVPATVPIFITYLQPIAAEQAALSGKFSQATSGKLLELSTATRSYNMKATYSLQLLAQGDVSPNYAQRVAHAALNLQQSRENVLAYINDVKRLMGQE